jgi:xanthine dehydrogenase accessory factor
VPGARFKPDGASTSPISHASALGKGAIARICIKPVPRVVIVGAGPEAAPLIRITRVLGWKCVVLDHRPSRLQAISALCDCRGPSRPGEALSLTTWTPRDAVIVMTHSATNDLDALRALSRSSPEFIGLLGPASRRNGLLSQLDPSERVTLERRLHAPVGLNLGGHGPEAIALSIAAELQQHFCQAA